jgi:hypothetical protein
MRAHRFLFVILAVLGASGAGVAFADNVLRFHSEPNDPIGLGGEVTYTNRDGVFALTPALYPNAIQVSFYTQGAEHWWTLTVMPADGASLRLGQYPDAQPWPFQSPGHPGLTFYGDGRLCFANGHFEVLDLNYDRAGNLTRFAANWEQRCRGVAAALRGQIRYNSTQP